MYYNILFKIKYNLKIHEILKIIWLNIDNFDIIINKVKI